MNWLHRAGYRVRQFGSAVATRGRPLAEVERTEVRAWLPTAAWPLFEGMPRNDQRHSLNVLRTLAAAGHDDPALMQAALLHDAAKSTGGVMLWHRVAVVLLKAVRPGWPARMAGRPAPRRSDLRYPFWASVNHPRLGAEMAAAAGCDPLAVTLIRRHQETSGGAEEPGSGHLNSAGSSHLDLQVSNFAPDDPLADKLLAALQAADDDN
jgi:hypothetical protein